MNSDDIIMFQEFRKDDIKHAVIFSIVLCVYAFIYGCFH